MSSSLLRSSNPFIANSCKRSRKLEEAYQTLNDAYFKSSLSPNCKIFLCSKSKNFGHGYAGFCSSKQGEIYIRNGLSENATMQTLVHEMAHLKVKEDIHGRAFVSELRRLRKLGAPLSAFELDVIPKSQKNVPSKILIHKAIFDALVIEGLPNKYVASYLEREFQVPLVEMERKAGDVRKMIDMVSRSVRDFAPLVTLNHWHKEKGIYRNHFFKRA